MPCRLGVGVRSLLSERTIGWAVLCCVLLGFGTSRASLKDDLVTVATLQADRRWAAAESLATSVLGRLESDRAPDSLAMAEITAVIVDSKQRRGAARDSVTLSQATRVLGIRGRHLTANDPRLADAHFVMASLFSARNDPDSAFSHARRAYEIRAQRLAPDDTLIAESLQQLGFLSRDRSDFVAATDYLERAFQQRLRAHDENRRVMATLLVEKAFTLGRSANWDASRAAVIRGIEIYERIGGRDDPDLARAIDVHASLERASGNLALGIELWQEALRVARLHYPDDDARVFRIRRNSNGALSDLGDYAGSARLMESLVPLYEKTYGPRHPRTLSARTSMAIACVGMDDSLRAMRELRALESLLVARPDGPADVLGLNLKFQNALLQQRGDYGQALAVCRRAIPIVRDHPIGQGTTLAELYLGAVTAQAALGDTANLENDRIELQRLTAQPELSGSNMVQELRLTNAIALRALRRPVEAWDEAIAADRIARERLQANARSLPERRSLQLSQQFSPSTDLVIDLARTGSDAQRVQAWDALARVRGLVRAEMARRRPPPEALRDTALAATHRRWVGAQRRYAQALVSSISVAEAPSLEPLRVASEETERELARAQRGRAPEPIDVTLAQVRSRLAPGQALVAFVETEASTDTARLTALIAKAGSEPIAWVELGRSAALRSAIGEWDRWLAASPRGDKSSARAASRNERRAGRAVRELTWDRIAPTLEHMTELIIVPDGPLLGMSWQALPVGDHQYFVETGPTLHVLNAEREWIERRDRAPAGSLLALGAVDFGSASSRSSSSPARLTSTDPCAGGLPSFAPLPATGVEAREVAHSWSGPTDLLLGAAATEEAFKRQAAGHQVLHLATHGMVTRDTCFASAPGLRGVGGVSPLSAPASGTIAPVAATKPAPVSPWLGRRVWLALAGANRASDHTADENEGLITAEEVLTLDLGGTDWVVLSACRSGSGETWSREGAIGMRRAFHLAGARTVIASQWSVDDEATREWMQALYAARGRGAATAGAAVQSASRAILAARRHDGRSTHPFYWGAFTASGE